MKHWTIRSRIVVSFAVILALMMVTAAVAYTRLALIAKLAGEIDTELLPGLAVSNQLKIDRVANYSLTEEYALQTDPAVRQKLQAAILTSRDKHEDALHRVRAARQLSRRTGTDGGAQERGGGVQTAQDAVLTPGSSGKGRDDLARRISAELYPQFQQAQAAADALVEHNRTQGSETTQQIETAVARARTRCS